MADTKIITRSDNAAALTIANHDQNHDSFAGVVEQWTGAATIDINDQNKTIECSSATAFTVTLDALSTISAALHTPNFKVTIKNINSGIITVSANAADDIDGAASMTLGKGQAVTLQTDSGNTVWKVVGGHGLTPGKNFIINGAFDIWQRGTGTFTTNGAYTADRWSMADDSSGAMTVDDDASVPTGLAGVSLKFSNSAAKFSIMRYRMESADSRQLANKFITLSLWAKSDGTSTCDLKVDLKSPTATDDFTSVGSAFNGTTIDASPTATWTYYSVVVGDALTLAEVTDGLQVSIFRDNTDATNASDTYIKNVKLEVGSTATDFSTAGANIAEELAMCQRYYYRQRITNTNDGHLATGYAKDANTCTFGMCLPVGMMRTTDITVSCTDITKFRLYGNGSEISPTAITDTTVVAGNVYANMIPFSITATGLLTQYEVYVLGTNSAASTYLEFSAEL